MRRIDVALAGLYAWSTALALGIALADIVITGQVGLDRVTRAETADLLLLLTGAVLLLGLAATAVCLGRSEAALPLGASLAVLVVGLFTPLLFAGPVAAIQGSLGIAIGPALRLGEATLVSMLAFGGFAVSVSSARLQSH